MHDYFIIIIFFKPVHDYVFTALKGQLVHDSPFVGVIIGTEKIMIIIINPILEG